MKSTPSLTILACLLMACSQGSFSGDSMRSKGGQKGVSRNSGGFDGALDGSSWSDAQVGSLGGDGNVQGQDWWPSDAGNGTGTGGNDGADGGFGGSNPGPSVGGGGRDTGDQVGADAGSASGDDIFGGDNSSGVPNNCVNQKILIVDLKSGWWDDDGGTLFEDVLRQEMTEVCNGVPTTIEYQHFTLDTNAPKYYSETNFGNYTQVWVLSGTVRNDISPTDPAFVDLVNQIRTHRPNLFLGAGFGSTPHVNAVAQTVWGADAFRTDFGSTYSLSVTSSNQNFAVKSRVRKLMAGNLFAGVDGHLADQMNFNVQFGFMAYTGSDEIITTLPGMKPIGSCLTAPYEQSTRTGPFMSPPPAKASREVPCIAVAQHNGQNIVLDSGLQRFYGAYKAEEGNVKRYLRNIARALAL